MSFNLTTLHIKIALLLFVMLGLPLMISAARASADQNPEVLAVVNGDTITSADLEEIIIRVHTGMDNAEKKSFDYRKLFDKLVNDRLLVQEAVNLGINDEPLLNRELDESRQTNAIRYFVRDKFRPDLNIDSTATESFFRDYYYRLQLRTVAVAQQDEAEKLLGLVQIGADMDSIARAESVDMYKYEGGLNNLKYYADVETLLRDRAANMKPGQLSEVFPYRQVYAFFRLEKMVPPDMSELPALSEKIKSILAAQKKETAWNRFIDSLAENYPIRIDSAALKVIADDGDKLFTPDFVNDDQTVALSIDADHGITSGELRKTVSHTAMSAGDQPFDHILMAGLGRAREELILNAAADHDGYHDFPEVVDRYHKSLDSALIEVYLQETIIPRIVFNHEEFEAYYDDHLDDFRKPEQFQLDRIETPDQKTADEIAGRLDEGADFEYIGRQYKAKMADEKERDQWLSLEVLPQSIRDEIKQLKPGQHSHPYQTQDGWVIFRIRARRPGEIQSLTDVDIDIRKIMFQKKFNELLDETIGILKENSDIQYNRKALETYFEDES